MKIGRLTIWQFVEPAVKRSIQRSCRIGPRRLRDRCRVGVPENVLVIGKQKHFDVTTEAADALRRPNQLALLIRLRENEGVLQRVSGWNGGALYVGDLDADQRRRFGLGGCRCDDGSSARCERLLLDG